MHMFICVYKIYLLKSHIYRSYTTYTYPYIHVYITYIHIHVNIDVCGPHAVQLKKSSVHSAQRKNKISSAQYK